MLHHNLDVSICNSELIWLGTQNKIVCVLCRLDTHMCMLNNAKAVLSKRIEQMPEEGLLLLLEETFPYVSTSLLDNSP